MGLHTLLAHEKILNPWPSTSMTWQKPNPGFEMRVLCDSSGIFDICGFEQVTFAWGPSQVRFSSFSLWLLHAYWAIVSVPACVD